MQPTLISSTSGLPLRKFGGEDAWRVYSSRGYVVAIQHVEDEPAAVLWPESQSMTDTSAGVYAVCMSAFPYWLTKDGEPTFQAFEMARAGYARMHRHPPSSPSELFNLMLAVIDAFTWIVRMPPKHRERPEPLFEAQTKVNGKTLHEKAV